ncbi:MAG: hypothetical protein A2010_13350 [Nitrospirae bacterium GWD2_57_9]|nr:MAG: hypothetical protein A2010_13350 [Nitrospirae bacterium GWD2_57_9]
MKMLEGLLRGFVAGLGIELGIRALVMLGLLPGIFPGFLFVVFWCSYSNYFYYNIAGDAFIHDLVAAIFLGLFFGAVAAMVLFLQGYGLKGIPLYLSGFSMLLSWATRLGVRRGRRRVSSF